MAGHEVDAPCRDRRLVVELDGREYHDSEAAFEHEREKDADLVETGYRVVRLTSSRLTDREAARLGTLTATRA